MSRLGFLVFAIPAIFVAVAASAQSSNECLPQECITWPGSGDCTECDYTIYSGPTSCTVCGPYSIGCTNGCMTGGWCDTGLKANGPLNVVRGPERSMRPLAEDWTLVRTAVKARGVRSRQKA
jgi:hypothetical protein